MISTRWIEKRKPHWARLEELVERSRSGVAALGHDELRELGLLYRQTASDLATVREDAPSRQLALYLNQLLGRAHNRVYMGRRPDVRGLLTFYRETYPRIFRATLPFTVAAFAFFLAAAAFGFLLAVADPAFHRSLLGPGMSDTIDQRKMWTESILAVKPLASSGIMTNNLSVSFAAFALGMTAGVGTIYILLLNGLMFGVINAACWQAGMLTGLWDFVAPHGVLELPAIFIAAGAGLRLAHGMLFPGLLPRKDSLVRAGGEAVRLTLGVIPLLVVAGIIEGFVSPTAIPTAAKFALAAGLGSLLAYYLLRSGALPAAGVAQADAQPARGK